MVELATGKAIAIDALVDVLFAPDGDSLIATGPDSRVRRFDSATGAELALLEHGDLAPDQGGFTPDGGLLLMTGSAVVEIWDPVRARLLDRFGADGQASGIAVTPDGTVVATGDGDGNLRLWTMPRRPPDLARLIDQSVPWRYQRGALVPHRP